MFKIGSLKVNGSRFALDGRELQIISGTIHYFRVLPEQWEDRLRKLKNCGFNTVETYIPWNIHEPEEESYCFEGIADVERFIKIAQSLGLYVIARPAPYICAEWEFGGMPYWLLKYPRMRLRCCDEDFLRLTDRFYGVLMPKLRGLLYENGGPIIAMQVENEYGSYGNDKNYIPRLKGYMEKYGIDTFFFTADGVSPSMLTGGLTEGIFATANFGDHPAESFARLDAVRPGLPHCCMEFWGGWLEHWGEERFSRDPKEVAERIDEMMRAGASFNIYAFSGGTNFGFYNGSNFEKVIQPTTTNYWMDGLLTENGDYTEKYRLVKDVISKYRTIEECETAPVRVKAYGKMQITEHARLFEHLNELSAPVKSVYPQTFEELGTDYGFVLYRTEVLAPTNPLPLNILGLHDRATVYLDESFVGIKDRAGFVNDNITVSAEDKNVKLDILVENLGRINYGDRLRDEKGILSGVSLHIQTQYNYTIYPLPLKDLSGLTFENGFTSISEPIFYRGLLEVEECADTFLDMTGFTKGVVFVNGFNLGRYWNIGPYYDLYVPGCLLKKGKNEIVIFEIEKAQSDCVTFNDYRK